MNVIEENYDVMDEWVELGENENTPVDANLDITWGRGGRPDRGLHRSSLKTHL